MTPVGLLLAAALLSVATTGFWVALYFGYRRTK